MARIKKDVTRGNPHSTYTVRYFDEAKEALENRDHRIISKRDEMALRQFIEYFKREVKKNYRE